MRFVIDGNLTKVKTICVTTLKVKKFKVAPLLLLESRRNIDFSSKEMRVHIFY